MTAEQQKIKYIRNMSKTNLDYLIFIVENKLGKSICDYFVTDKKDIIFRMEYNFNSARFNNEERAVILKLVDKARDYHPRRELV